MHNTTNIMTNSLVSATSGGAQKFTTRVILCFKGTSTQNSPHMTQCQDSVPTMHTISFYINKTDMKKFFWKHRVTHTPAHFHH